MRKLITIGAMVAGLSTLALAETWNGTLLDADCAAHQHKSAKTCEAKRSSAAYVLDVNGTRYRFDAKSNDQVRRALDSRADRASNPDAIKSAPVNAKVTGHTGDSGKIHADLIEIQ